MLSADDGGDASNILRVLTSLEQSMPFNDSIAPGIKLAVVILAQVYLKIYKVLPRFEGTSESWYLVQLWYSSAKIAGRNSFHHRSISVTSRDIYRLT